MNTKTITLELKLSRQYQTVTANTSVTIEYNDLDDLDMQVRKEYALLRKIIEQQFRIMGLGVTV